MKVITGTSITLQKNIILDVGRYRHRVFVELLGWQLQTPDGLEFDQFDREDTLYVVAVDQDDAVVGTTRLLPTTSPYLLGEVFPELLGGLPIPCSEDIWELSRFAAADFKEKNTSALSQFSSTVADSLFRASMACVRRRGARTLVTVSPLGIERLLMRYGYAAHRIAPPKRIDGHPVVALSIDVEENAL